MADREAEVGARRAVEETFRADYGRVLAILVRDLRDIDLAEEALQDALVEALRAWPKGKPDNPPAWIVTTARRRAIDRLRRRARAREKLEQMAPRAGPSDVVLEALLEDQEIPDERLRLIFTCCHPALARQDAVELALRTVGGLTTREIATAFLVKEATMQARLTRAKRRIRDAAIPYRVPEHHELPERLATVLDVVALAYNEGYTPAGEAPVRDLLRREAIGMAAVLSLHLPDEPEALGCHALLLFHETRAPARISDGGEVVSLEEQDRSLWNLELADQGEALLQRALLHRRPGPYQLQAAISALHSASPSPQATDWEQIVLLYDELLAIAPSPTTSIGRAIAVGLAYGPRAGLDALPDPDPPLDTFHRWHAARADLLRRAGDHRAAAAEFAAAAALARNPAERRWLLAQQQRCERESD